MSPVATAVLSVIHYVQCHQLTVQALVTHQYRKVEQLWGNIRIFYAEKNLLVIVFGLFCLQMGFFLDDDLLGGMLSHQRTDDASKQNHHDDTVQHDIVDEILSWCHFKPHAHHDHGDSTCGVSRCQAEHDIAIGFSVSE